MISLEDWLKKPISERLRAPEYWISGSDEGHEGENNLPLEAADLIDRLEAERLSLIDAGIEVSAERDALKEEVERLKEKLKEAEKPRYPRDAIDMG